MTSPAPPAAGLIARLRELGSTVGTAESLTGGLVCAALTDVPGASAVVRGGVVSYAVEVKEGLLGVPAQVLREHGAVSRECAEAMALGARLVLGVDWAVATTGVAGPDPSEGGPVGRVHVAVAGDVDGEQRTAHRVLDLTGDRAQIRATAVTEALLLLSDTLGRALSAGRGTVGDHPAPGRTEQIVRRDDDDAAAT